MPVMSVTKEVSKLSSWLKAFASCRVERRACDTGSRCAGRKAGELKGVGQQRAQGARTWTRDWGAGGGRARAGERTANMERISVTLDVLKPTGWLKAVAACRVESRACDAGRGAGWVIGRLGADTGGQESGRNAQEECGLWFQVEARIAPRTC